MVDDLRAGVANAEELRALMAAAMALEDCASSRQDIILATDQDCL